MSISKWEGVEEKLVQIEAWCRDGLLEKDIAHNLGIGESTLCLYKTQHMELVEALKRGKEVVDITVENALYKRCIGYSYDEITKERQPIYTDGIITGYEMVETKRVTKEVLPDPVSTFFWLKNRRKDQWRDKREVENTIEVKAPILEEIQNTFKNMRMLNEADVIDVDIAEQAIEDKE